MTDAPVISFVWEGDGFKPASPFWARKADQHYVIGEKYDLTVHQARSSKSHRHYFVAVHQAWLNLPEDLADQFPTDEHLRKYALIKAGYCDSTTLVCESRADAVMASTFIRAFDSGSIIVAKDNVVTRYTAKSQSEKAMGNEEFNSSKQRVMEVLAGMIGVTVQ